MSRFQAVIFDLDGTLLDSIADLTDAMNTVLLKMGHAIHRVDDYKHMVGEGVRMLVVRALPEAVRDDVTIERCVAMLREEYGKSWAVKTQPYEGIVELLEALTARRVKMSVLSNKIDELTKRAVSHFFSGYSFAYVMGAISPLPIKPDPTGALWIARNLYIEPDKILFLGDSDTDMKTAAAAGMNPVGALWGFRTEDELWESGARAVLHHPLALLDLLE